MHQKTRAFLDKTKERFSRWSGLDLALGLWQELKLPKRSLITSEYERYQANLALAKTLAKQPFVEVLASWGIKTSADLQAYQRQKWLAVICGLLIFLLGLTGLLQAVKDVSLTSAIIILADLSVMGLGLVLGLTSVWRLNCLRQQRFVPFGRWLKNPFKIRLGSRL